MRRGLVVVAVMAALLVWSAPAALAGPVGREDPDLGEDPTEPEPTPEPTPEPDPVYDPEDDSLASDALNTVGDVAGAALDLLGLDGIGRLLGLGGDEKKILGEILAELSLITKIINNIRRSTETVRDIQETVFPDEVLQKISTIFSGETNPIDWLKDLEHQWSFSPRTRVITKKMREGRALSRDEWEAIMGSIPDMPGRDLDEYRDFAAVRRLGVVGDFFKRNEEWTREQLELLNATKDSSTSVGLAERFSALAAAAMGNHLLEGAKIEANALDVANERLMMRRHKRRLRAHYAILAYSFMSGDQPEGTIVGGEDLGYLPTLELP